MPDIQQLLIFMAAGVLLNLTPGPDVLFIFSHSLRGGLRFGFVAAVGITTGCFFHLGVATLGLGGLLATSSSAFNFIKWVGVAYLIWMGLRLFWGVTQSVESPPNSSENFSVEVAAREMPSLFEVFLKAFATNALNPKVALFYLAFVPQFIPVNAPDPAWTFVLLGCVFNFNGLLVCLAWAFFAAWLSERTNLMHRGLQRLDRLTGFMFVAFGLRLAFSHAPSA